MEYVRVFLSQAGNPLKPIMACENISPLHRMQSSTHADGVCWWWLIPQSLMAHKKKNLIYRETNYSIGLTSGRKKRNHTLSK